MHGEVVEVRPLTPSMVRVVLGGDGLEDFTPIPFTDQYVNALFLPEGSPWTVPFDVEEARSGPPEGRPVGRRYTVRAWDPDARLLTIDFVVHGAVGHAGRWANHARTGDLLQLTGPSGGYAPSTTADWHLMVGDESALPAIAAALERLPAGARAKVYVEVGSPADELPLAGAGEIEVRWLHRDGRPFGEPLVEAVRALEFPPGRVHAFVHGEAGAMKELRRLLRVERGVPRGDLSISGYWRRGMDDEGWRSTKPDWNRQVAAEDAAAA